MLAVSAIGYWWYRQSSDTVIVQGMGPLESALKQQGFRMYKPPREGSWGVGTIVRFVEDRPSVIMSAEQVLAGHVNANKNRVGFPNYAFRGTFANEGVALVPKLAEANIEHGDKLKTTIMFGDPVLQTVPLINLQRRLNEIPDLRRHFKGGSNLFVVTEVLQVSTLEYKFGIDQEGSIGSGFSAKDVQAKMQDKFRVTANGNLTTTFPLLLGYKVQPLEVVAVSLGGGGQIRITELPQEQLERVIRSRPQLHSDFQLFGLAIGLGNYTSYSGGKLPGYEESVGVVANRLKQLRGPKGSAYVEVVHSPPKGQAEGSHGAISRQQIIDTVDRFARAAKGRMTQDSNNLVVFYYFGHGLSEPLSRTALLAPEDFADLPDKEVRQVWQDLILVREIVRKLEQLPGRVLVLIDACRSRDRENEIQPETFLNPVLPPGIGQLLAGQDLQPWPNYFDGPGLVIFSSKDRQEAFVVPHVMSNGHVAMIGPLAERFDQLWLEAVAREQVLSFKQLASGLTTS
ncbi:MAG: caspase family protein, partial [Terriglobia bacterium]